MGSEGDAPDEGLEARIARLEARMARLEAGANGAQQAMPGLSPAPSRAPSPASAPIAPSAPEPAAVPGTYWQSPTHRKAALPWIPPASVATPAAPSSPPSAAAAPRPYQPPAPPPFAATLAELEDRLAGRALAVVGGVALILGAIFFLSLAFSRGWIGPELRVLIGLVAGSASVGGGAAFLERRNTLLGNVLTPVGLAIITLSLIGATRLYHIVPTEIGLVGALLSALIVAMVAVRNDSQLVAAFGLISVLAAPPLLGAHPDTTTIAFIGAVLVGTTSVAVWRSWRWLPPLAFVLTVPQAASWIGSHPPASFALIGIAGLWALNIVAAGGEEFRRHRDYLSNSAATLLLGNTAFTVWAGFATLQGDLADYRGLFLLVVAVAHLAVGGYFIARDGERNLFALLTIGTGIAALTMAVPVQLDGPPVPIAWTAEAAAMAWVAARRGHPYSAAMSAVLYLLAGAVVMTLYPIGRDVPAGFPFLDARAGALAFVLGGAAVGVWFVRDRSLRSALSAFGLLIAIYCASTVLGGVPYVFAMTALMVAAAAVSRALPLLPSEPIQWLVDGLLPPRLRGISLGALETALPIVIVLSGGLATVRLALAELPLADIGRTVLPAIPFTDAGALGAGILIAGVLAAGWMLGDPIGRRAAVLIAASVLAYAIPYEVPLWAVAVLWVVLGLGARFVARRNPVGEVAFDVAGGIAIAAAAFVAIGVVAPPSRLLVGPIVVGVERILQAVVALGAVVVGVAAFGRSWPEPTLRRWIGYGAGVLAVYLLSALAVDIVGLQGRDAIALEEVRTQGHVVLSVLWAALGVGAFVWGLRSNRREVRQGGLVLLAVATTKVFLFDLAELDVAYRVISLIALGLLLLASAWLWQRAQPKHESGPP